MMDDWKSLFRPHILARGLDYYESGAVEALERTGHGFHARVEGAEDYEVDIWIKDNRIHDMECSCPYALGGEYCKHMAAVLYKAEEGKGREASDKTWEERYQDSRKELRDVIQGIPEEELRHILENMALEDESLRNRILTRYSATISLGQIIRLKKEIEDIAYRYSDRYGYVDWESAGGYISEMESFLYDKVQALIEKGCYMQAFELTNQVFATIGNQDMDDSAGGTDMVADACYKIWQQILEKCGGQDKNKMQSWFEKHQSDGTVIDYMEGYIGDFLMNEFHDRELLQKKMEELDQQIEKRGESTDCGKCYSSYRGFENNILKRLQIMKDLGASEEEIGQYRKKNRRFAAVRMLEIEEFIQAGKNREAVRVLMESKELDRKSPAWVKEYSQKLIELYKQMHMDKEYKEELLFQVFFCEQDSLDPIAKLKEVCEPKEWEQNRERLLECPSVQGIKLSLLESEKMFDRLLDEVISSGSIYMMDRYEKVLKKAYPDRMRTAYAAYVKKQAEIVSDRRRYKELMAYLKKIASYPQGRETAGEIAREWRMLYKRRTAMMDELRKAGL
ncbi:MAG: SWIM zinc finger family protein [[Clostridium] symbiosum]|nr:SWIM zinc finger family protein [[Clostridium] symbiosum]MDY4529593.1 SWIM zinc finger family protein [Enterocloster aldenensis]